MESSFGGCYANPAAQEFQFQETQDTCVPAVIGGAVTCAPVSGLNIHVHNPITAITAKVCRAVVKGILIVSSLAGAHRRPDSAIGITPTDRNLDFEQRS
jgi:hypothetical protein